MVDSQNENVLLGTSQLMRGTEAVTSSDEVAGCFTRCSQNATERFNIMEGKMFRMDVNVSTVCFPFFRNTLIFIACHQKTGDKDSPHATGCVLVSVF